MKQQNSSGRLAGKTALITGAAQGLGKAFAEKFIAEGARVCVSDIQLGACEAWTAEYGNAALCTSLDVTSEQDWIAAIKFCETHFAGLDILVNNAGVGELGNVVDMSFDQWKRVHSINLDSVFLGCKYAIPLMEKSGGSIVNISSVAGIIASANYAAYNSSKAAVRHLTKSVALYGAKLDKPIRCNSVHPVFVNTPILDPLKELFGEEKALEKLSRQIPLGRVGQAEEIANAVLFLASDESSMMTGSEMVLDGGISAQ